MDDFQFHTFTNISNKKTFYQDFLVILKRMPQNYKKILMKCFLDIIYQQYNNIYLECPESSIVK